MTRRGILAGIGMAAVMSFGVTAAHTVSAAEAITLKFGNTFPPPPAMTSLGVEYFEKLVTERSKGRVKFQNFWNQTLFGTGDSLEAVGDGRADVLMYAQVFAPGKTPLAVFQQWFPFGPEDPVMIMKMRFQILKEIPAFEQEMERYGGKIIGFTPLLRMDVVSKDPIRAIADLKGKKLAAIGSELPAIAKYSGAVPVVMPSQQRYMAAQRGVIDGEFILWSMSKDFRMYELLKHYTRMNIQGGHNIHLVVNLKTWNRMPPDVQKIVADAGRESSMWHAERLREYGQRGGELEQFLKKQGAQFHEISDAEKKAYADGLPDFPAQWAAEMDAKGLPGSQIVKRWVELAEANGWKWVRRWGSR